MERRAVLHMDIATLKLPELRRLLAAAHDRGQDALAQQLEAEIAARGVSKPSVPAPAVEDDEVLPMAFDDPSDDLADVPSPDMVLQLPGARQQQSSWWPAALAGAGVLAMGGALAWGLNGAPGLPRSAPPPAARSAGPATPPPAPRAMALQVEPPAPQVDEVTTPAAADEAVETASVEAASVEPPAPRPKPHPCAAPPSPAERLLCNDLGLNLLDHEMREAYGRAIADGADPIALRESQAAWRRERDPVGDPRTLAELYDQRIRELKAAAPPPP